MKLHALIVALFLPTAAGAVDLTFSKASPVEGHPVARVSRIELAPPEGIVQAPARARPEYVVESPRVVGRALEITTAKVPMPSFNPYKVSFCPVEEF